LKIATFNINDVNKRLTNLLLWLASSKPDVACLQELKATDRAFPADALLNAGYCAVWKGERTWNGVAILSPYRAMTTMPRPDTSKRPSMA
jgi:exodeoxyribonuclease III